MRRQHIKARELFNLVRVIKRHAYRCASAAIMPCDTKCIKAQMLHYIHLVLRHSTEGVVHVIGRTARLVAVAIAAQIRAHHSEMFCKARRNQVPMHMRQRIAMQQQNRRAIAAVSKIDFDFAVAGLNLCVFEAFEHVYSRKFTVASRRRPLEFRRRCPTTSPRQTSALSVRTLLPASASPANRARRYAGWRAWQGSAPPV